MALAFQSTSIGEATAALAGATTQSTIRDALLAHASGAWTLVEEFDSAGGTIHWVVIKNSTVISGVGSDFYVVIGRNVASGQLCIFLGEVYTQATHTLSTYAPYSTASATNTILADFSYAASSGGATASFALGTTFPGQTGPLAPVNIAAATMRFVTTIEQDYAIIVVNTTAIYIGALTDLIVPMAGLVAATPIGIADLWNTNQGAAGALTRHPIAAADAPYSVAYCHSLYTIENYLTHLQRHAWTTSLYGFADRFQANRIAASELAAMMFAGGYQNASTNVPNKTGMLRGKFKGIRLTTFPAAAVAYDTIVVDGRKHLIIENKNTPSFSDTITPYNYSNVYKFGHVIDTGIAA